MSLRYGDCDARAVDAVAGMETVEAAAVVSELDVELLRFQIYSQCVAALLGGQPVEEVRVALEPELRRLARMQRTLNEKRARERRA